VSLCVDVLAGCFHTHISHITCQQASSKVTHMDPSWCAHVWMCLLASCFHTLAHANICNKHLTSLMHMSHVTCLGHLSHVLVTCAHVLVTCLGHSCTCHLSRDQQVDPIVASFCGGSVGVLSALLVVEINNIRKQQRNRCHYCDGTGYLSCGNCVGTGYVEVCVCVCVCVSV
jgi:hypothetical protein